jgi:hypothetical protein
MRQGSAPSHNSWVPPSIEPTTSKAVTSARRAALASRCATRVQVTSRPRSRAGATRYRTGTIPGRIAFGEATGFCS